MLNTHRLRALCALVAALALVAFTGCGGDDKKSDSGGSSSAATTPATTTTPADTGSDTGGGDVEQYKTAAQKAATDFKESAQKASQEVQSASTPEGKIAGLDSLKDSVNQAADDFEALDPPANVKADNDKLVTEFRDLAGTVDQVKQALQTNDTKKATDALQKLQKSQTDIASTISSIQSKIGG